MNAKSWQFRSLIGASTIAVSAAVALGATAAAGGAGARSEVSSVGAMVGHANAPVTSSTAAAATKLTLLGTYVESDSPASSVPASALTPIDQVNKLTCPSGHTCTITATISVQLGGPATAGNAFFTPWMINGVLVGEHGPSLGEVPTDGFLVGATWTDQQAGITGKAKVQSFVQADDGATLDNWTVTYNIYD
jgi:hypothetical protein